MASLNTKTKLYLKANSKTWDDTKVELQDDGSGPYISVWNYDGLAKPSDSKIAEYEAAGNAEESAQTVLINRKKDYPSVVDQLDKIYHEGIDEWKKLIKVTKDKYPKG